MAARSVLPPRQKQTTAQSHAPRLLRNVADNGSGCKRIFACWQGYQMVNRLSLTQLRRGKISEVFPVACRQHLSPIFPMFFRLLWLRHNSSQTR
jgi:hypothetical protein